MELVKILFVGLFLFGITWIVLDKKRIWKAIVEYAESCTNRRIAITLYLMVVVSQVWMIFLRKLPISSDEIYSMSGASFFAGYDWSSYMQLKKFYNFGYTMLFSPIYKLFENPVTIYRAMLFGNLLIQALMVVMVYYIMRKKYKCTNIFSIAGALICACNTLILFFSGFMYNEIPLAIIVWVLVLLLFELSDATGKRRVYLSILIGVSAAYAYIIHSRCLIVYGALALLILVFLVVYKKCLVHPIAFIASFAPCIYLEKQLMDYVQSALYLKGTDVVMQNSVEHVVTGTWRYRAFTSLDGIADLFARFFTLAGSLTIQTGGLLTIITVVVLYYIVKNFKRIRSGKEDKKTFILVLFSLLALWTMVFAVAVTGAANRKFRFLLYTRYFTPFIGPFLLSGLLLMKKRKALDYKWIVIWTSVITLIVLMVFDFYAAPMLHGKSMKEITSFYLFLPFARYAGRVKFDKNVFIIAFALLIAFTIGILYLYKRKQMIAICTVVMIFSASLFWKTEDIQCIPSSNRRVKVVDATAQLLQSDIIGDKEIYCVGKDLYRKTLMFVCYDKNEQIVYRKKEMNVTKETIMISNNVKTLLRYTPLAVYRMDGNEWIGIWDKKMMPIMEEHYPLYVME